MMAEPKTKISTQYPKEFLNTVEPEKTKEYINKAKKIAESDGKLVMRKRFGKINYCLLKEANYLLRLNLLQKKSILNLL